MHALLTSTENIADHSFSPLFLLSGLQPDDDLQLHVVGHNRERKRGSTEHQQLHCLTPTSLKLPSV